MNAEQRVSIPIGRCYLATRTGNAPWVFSRIAAFGARPVRRDEWPALAAALLEMIAPQEQAA